jgi:hypothetical protein
VEAAAPSKRSPEHGFILAGALLGVVLLAVLAWFVAPDPRGYGTHEKLGLPPCAMMKWFHVPCPGCGVTTSVTLAAHARFLDAARTQPFGLVVAFAIPLAAVWALVGHFRGRDLYRDLVAVRLRPWLWWIGGALALSWFYKLAVVFGAFPGLSS